MTPSKRKLAWISDWASSALKLVEDRATDPGGEDPDPTLEREREKNGSGSNRNKPGFDRKNPDPNL